MSIFKPFKIIISIIANLFRSNAGKLLNQLPQETLNQLIYISKTVEGVKQYLLADNTPTITELMVACNTSEEQLYEHIRLFWQQKGVIISDLQDGLNRLANDAKERTETGLKSLWTGLFNVVAAELSNIPWATLLLGIGQMVFERFVKGRVKI